MPLMLVREVFARRMDTGISIPIATSALCYVCAPNLLWKLKSVESAKDRTTRTTVTLTELG